MFAIGILLAPILVLVAFFYTFWYGGLLFDWIWNNLLGLIDLVGIIGDTSYFNSGYSQGFTQQGFSSNQNNRREDYYQDFDFKFEDANQPYFQIKDPKGYYKVLEVDYNASQEEMKSAYRRLAKEYHSDLHPENKVYWDEMMKKINLAKEVLTDPIKRVEYDQEWKQMAV